MLENEPDTNSSTEQPQIPPAEPAAVENAAVETSPPASPPRRRRAASRPAGPPTSSTAPTQVEPAAPVAQPATPPAPEPEPVSAAALAEPTLPPEPSDLTPAEPGPPGAADAEPAAPAKKTTKRAPAKRPAKKAAVGEDEAPKARAPRKRAVKKTAAPAADENLLTQGEPVAEPVEETPSLSTNDIPNPFADPEPVPAEAADVDLAAETTDPAEALALPIEVEPVEAEIIPDPAAEVVEEPADQDEAAEDQTAEDDKPADEVDDESDDDSGDGLRRRRRRRGGRRRRRTGSDDDAADTDPDFADADGQPAADVGSGDAEPGDTGSGDTGGGGEGEDDPKSDSETQRRRRRRRRRGEDAGSAPDDPTEVVVRVREPRRAAKVNNEVTGIEGSTRMEAKRQRRRDGREAGRRRPPILSEAEFLARRESVSRKMIVRQFEDLSQIAVLEDDILVEHYVDRDSAASLIGNVYLGRVQNVLPSMEAAFIDIGRGRNAVLYAGEVDWDSFGAEGQNRKVEKVFKSGQTILVQVSKDPVGAKGARLTNHVSIPGRYLVYAPGGHLSGISRKLPDVERKRLRDILADLVGESASVIVRTAAEGASEDELIRDVNRLKAQWADIERKVASGTAPQLLYGEPDLTVRIVRDLFTEDFSELIIDGNQTANDAYDAVDGYVTHVAPHLKERLRRWEGEDGLDVFAAYRLDEQIAKGLERKVFLPSGGSLVIDRTEAMTVIDVNTGKFTGSGGNLEATVTSNNLEAAEEIVRQLRLRDIGGIIVIDFIDMVLPNNRELLLRRLVECLSRDRTRHQVAEVTSLGLVQMTRKKIGTGLLEAFTSECPHCNGRGFELHDMPVESQRQADGGAREGRPRDQRRGGGNGSGGGRDGGGGSASPKPTEPAKGPEVVSEHGEANHDDGQGSSLGDDRGGRSRRGGGRSRRGSASREQGPPDAVSEPQHAEPVSAG